MDRRGVRKIYPFSIPYGIDFRKVKEIIEKLPSQFRSVLSPMHSMR